MNINNIPVFLNTFVKRKPFLDINFFYYEKYFPQSTIFLALDKDEYYIESNLNINILTYDDIPTTSYLMHECHSRYYRHLFSLKYLESKGYEYVMNYMDDGWVNSVDWEKLNKSISYLNDNNADRIDLCGPQLHYPLIFINDDISFINPNNDITWYQSNQCAIWKIKSLIKIYEILGPDSDTEVERRGSEVARQLKCKFLTFNSPVIDNEGWFQRKVGFKGKGKELLKYYCEETNNNFKKKITELEKFI